MDMKSIILAGGGPSKLAAKVSLSHSTILGWGEVPVKHLRAVAEATGIPAAELRPDVAMIFAPQAASAA